MKPITTILLGFISVLLVAYLGVSSTFMWRMDARGYELNEVQTRQTTILENQNKLLDDHEERIRKVERVARRPSVSSDGT